MDIEPEYTSIKEHYLVLDPFLFEDEASIRERAELAHKKGRQYFPIFFQIRNHPTLESFVVHVCELWYEKKKQTLSFKLNVIVYPEHINDAYLAAHDEELTMFTRHVIMDLSKNDNSTK